MAAAGRQQSPMRRVEIHGTRSKVRPQAGRLLDLWVYAEEWAMKLQQYWWTGFGILTVLLMGGCATQPDHGSGNPYGPIQHTNSQAGMQQAADNAELTVPNTAPMTYPEDWPELSRRRQLENSGK